ncbi:hypothetical protein [Halorarum salinum]|uniref:Uncharacterized protein n=1 Tax=Halorarum salinum TaxID=2743089 RepID=A0A7D5LAJ5_9EURY|nr:hypothetical protein [Halobaculum salinum]QLG61968.1 hypothetical protein HUG12_09645 [Halobaculum salinum]
MDDTLKLIGAATGVIGLGLLSAYYTGTWEDELVLYLGLLVLAGGLLYIVVKRGYLESVTEKLEAADSLTPGFGTVKDLDVLWADLQAWEAEDPRNTELVWNHQLTDTSMIAVPAENPEFFLYSIMTPTKTEGEDLHIVVETTTGSILHHVSNDEDYEYEKNRPFDSVPFVQEFRLAMMLNVMERKEVKNWFKKASLGQLPGGYRPTPMDRETEQAMTDATNGQWHAEHPDEGVGEADRDE